MHARPLTVLLTLATLAQVGPARADAGPARPSPADPKRGISGDGRRAASMNAAWYYTWYIDPAPATAAEFVPMIAHGADANAWYFDRVMALKRQGRVTTLLGFNEPDRPAPAGGGISVDDAVRAWPLLERTGLRLGSPAPAMDPAGRRWLDAFMAVADARHLRVDFVALHWYGDVAPGAAAAPGFLTWLRGVHDRYHRPVWVTEFAGLNWDWLHHPVTAEQNRRFVAAVEPLLDRAPWVERYCWFDDRPANLFDDPARTRPSRLGQVYRGDR